jgi:hypothetical protein
VKVEITRSGGVGGFALRRSVNEADLSPEDADALRHLVDELLSPSVQVDSTPELIEADRFTYEISVTGDQESRQQAFDETRLTPTGLELVRQLWQLASPAS